MPYVGNPVGGPKHKPQWAKDEDARIAARHKTEVAASLTKVLAPPFKEMAAHALWAREVQTFLRRRIGNSICDRSISISFATELEAEQFAKLLLRSKRIRARSRKASTPTPSSTGAANFARCGRLGKGKSGRGTSHHQEKST